MSSEFLKRFDEGQLDIVIRIPTRNQLRNMYLLHLGKSYTPVFIILTKMLCGVLSSIELSPSSLSPDFSSFHLTHTEKVTSLTISRFLLWTKSLKQLSWIHYFFITFTSTYYKDYFNHCHCTLLFLNFTQKAIDFESIFRWNTLWVRISI